MSQQLSRIAGEFISSEVEASFQADRLSETVRQLRSLFLLSIVFNALFFIIDWRFHGQPHFLVVVPGRAGVVLISAICAYMLKNVRDFGQAEKVSLLWRGVTALSVAVLVTSQSDIAFFVVLLLPLIFYLAVPSAFRWTVVSGVGCSTLMLLGYLLPEPVIINATGLVLAVIMFNSALVLVVIRANRLQRLEWSATRAAQQANRDLAASQDRLEKMFMAVPLPLVVTDRQGRIIKYNDASVKFFGSDISPSQIKSIDEIYVRSGDRKRFLEIIATQGELTGFETRIRVGDGTERDVLLAARAINMDGVDVLMTGTVDITQRKMMENRLEQLATTDPLTGLSNRNHFFEMASSEIATMPEPGKRLAMVLLDVDHFKQINDTLGHDAGDMMLQAFAERLTRSVRSGDVVARLGGDEFAILLTGLDNEDQVILAIDSILERLREPLVYEGHALECRASFGASIFPIHADNADDLMKDADIALYMAKTEGRGRALVYQPQMRSIMEKRSSMINRARRALDDDQIVPYYQPKISFRTGRVTGFEALLRWRHPNRGIQPPAAISAAFNDPEVAAALSDRMLAKVICDVRRWLDDGLDFGQVAVNASAAEFRQNNFAERMLERLHAAGVPNERIELEVTETVFLGRGAESVHRALHCLSAAGIRIALDDFGTGYASLSHLKQFPVDILKIDQSFVRDLEIDPDDAAIIRAVINLGQSLGIGIVAEGVETTAQARYLKAQGCDYGQGYLFGRPMPARQLPKLLSTQAHGAAWRLDDDVTSSAAA